MKEPHPLLKNILQLSLLALTLLFLLVTFPRGLVQALVIADICFAVCLFFWERSKYSSFDFPIAVEVGRLNLKTSLRCGLEKYSMLSCGYFVFLVLPMFLLVVRFKMPRFSDNT